MQRRLARKGVTGTPAGGPGAGHRALFSSTFSAYIGGAARKGGYGDKRASE
jgi:hypothetical protein